MNVVKCIKLSNKSTQKKITKSKDSKEYHIRKDHSYIEAVLLSTFFRVKLPTLANTYSMANTKKPSFLLLVDVEMTLYVEMFSIGIRGIGRASLQNYKKIILLAKLLANIL